MRRCAAIALLAAMAAAPIGAAGAEPSRASQSPGSPAGADIAKLVTDAGGGLSAKSLMQSVALITVLAIAPAILVLVTCFTRIVVVLGLLRQALATGSLPPNQVLFGLALLMTVVVMAPVYQAIHHDAIRPYMAGEIGLDQATAARKSTRGNS